MRFLRPESARPARRDFLRLAGSGLLGSMVVRLDREARGAETAQRRYVLYNHGNGLQRFHLAKSEVQGPEQFKLGAFMQAFAGHESVLGVAENLYCSPGKYLHGNASSALSCADRGMPKDGGTGVTPMIVGGPTIDQTIANHIQGQTRLRSLVLGHPFGVSNGNCAQGTIVGRAKNEPVYPILDPLKAHELVFGVRNQDRVLLELQASYLDFVKDDIASFQTSLPAGEKQKLEQYLESVREVERSLTALAPGQCPELERREYKFAGRNHPELWRYMLDLGVAALQCGATHQLTLLHTYGCVHHTYTFDGVSRNHHEDVAHTDEKGAFMDRILRYHADNVVYLYDKLAAIPTGTGTMADDLLVQWMSDGGGQHHNGTRQHAVIFLGRASGALKTGRWLRYPDEKHPLACAHLLAARAMGIQTATFGDGTDPCDGPLPEFTP